MGSQAGAHLLDGPRGRRLCLLVADRIAAPGGEGALCTVAGDDPTRLAAAIAGAITPGTLASISGTTDPVTLLGPLADTVGFAMYWQEPDPEDRALDDPEAARALRPIARALTEAPAARWWSGPLASEDQRYVQWLDEPRLDPPARSGAEAELSAWRARALDDERRAALDDERRAALDDERRAAVPPDPEPAPRPTAKLSDADPPPDAEPGVQPGSGAEISGIWWSTPRPSRLVTTTRSLPGVAAVGLRLVEDEQGNERARCWRLAPQRDPRVYEITGPRAWATLTARYPLDVTYSRRHDWRRVSEWTGAWTQPDWAAVAADYDAVHLTVEAYLTTAGRAIPVGPAGPGSPASPASSGDGARTMLAGWEPDKTYWLTDILAARGPVTDWREVEDDAAARWEQA